MRPIGNQNGDLLSGPITHSLLKNLIFWIDRIHTPLLRVLTALTVIRRFWMHMSQSGRAVVPAV